MMGNPSLLIISLVFSALVQDGFQSPLQFKGNTLVDRQDDENGALTDQNFENANSPDFDSNKTEHDEDSDQDLFEGDIQGDKEALRAIRSSVTSREVLGHEGKKWPKYNGVVAVPYTFPSSMSSNSQDELAKVITEYETKTCIKLIPHTDEKDYVHINPNTGSGTCNSPLGMSGGKQTINFGENCSWGNLAHEFMHSLGFFHEHTRSDRDNYVTVDWDAIAAYEAEKGEDHWKHNFDKCTDSGCKDLDVGYDYGSIMHYGQYLGSTKVMTPKQSGATIGQRQQLSTKDIEGLNEYYCSGPDTPRCRDTWTQDCTEYPHICNNPKYEWFTDACQKTCQICTPDDAVDCKWGSWSVYSTCSKTCGDGTQSRQRSAVVEAANGGATCSGESTETRSCNDGACSGNVFGCTTDRVALKSYHGKYVIAESDGTANANSDERNSWETFTVEDLGSNKISLLSYHGKYLVAEDGYEINANRDRRDSWEEFTVEQHAGGTIALKTAHGRYVVAKSDGRLRGDSTVAGTWERFTPECISEGTDCKDAEAVWCANRKNNHWWNTWCHNGQTHDYFGGITLMEKCKMSCGGC